MEDAETERHTICDIVKRLVELGTDVVRVECRLYPTMFPAERTFTILNPDFVEEPAAKKIEPFKEVTEQVEEYKKRLEALDESENNAEALIEVVQTRSS